MTRLPDWQLRQILPALVNASRQSPTPNRALEATIAELVMIAQRRGMQSVLVRLEHDAARAAVEHELARAGPIEWEKVTQRIEPVSSRGNGPASTGPSAGAVSDR